jgi:signal transduction histidine kinase
MERVLTAGGPTLAPRPAMTPGDRGAGWTRRPRLAACATRWSRDDLWPLGYHLAVAVALAGVRYPAWRIAALAAAAGVLEASLVTCRTRDVQHCVNARTEEIARFVVLNQWGLLLSTALAVAVTGGLASPLVVTLVAPYFAAVAPLGDRRPTRHLLVALALLAGALSLLPAAWAAPALSAPARGLLTALAVLGTGALLAPVHVEVRRKRDEIIRARREAASEAIARAQSVEQLGSRVAHDLKNPLTGVKALVQLGLRNPAEAPSHERLEVVEREIGRMQEILQNYLAFTRPARAMTPRAVALGPLVRDTLVLLSARADDAGVRLYADGEATVEVDPGRLKDALLNLVTNAIEATPPGGEVAVEVRPRGERAELVVRDTGRGMPDDVLRRIGTPFFTTRDDGTGLGVVLARTAIAQHGGSLRYESEPGRGTRVSVTLPRAVSGTIDAARAAGR